MLSACLADLFELSLPLLISELFYNSVSLKIDNDTNDTCKWWPVLHLLSKFISELLMGESLCSMDPSLN
jgi:hypothetical protein